MHLALATGEKFLQLAGVPAARGEAFPFLTLPYLCARLRMAGSVNSCVLVCVQSRHVLDWGHHSYLMSISTSSGLFPLPMISATLSSDLAEEFEKLSSCSAGTASSEIQGRKAYPPRGRMELQPLPSTAGKGINKAIDLWRLRGRGRWENHHDHIVPCLNQSNAAVRPNKASSSRHNDRHFVFAIFPPPPLCVSTEIFLSPGIGDVPSPASSCWHPASSTPP